MKRLALIALAGCATFEDPNIVLDIRPLAMHATRPEQVIDVDLNNPPPAAELLQQILPSTVCMLVADPTNFRRLRWTMTLCPYGDGERCDDDHPQNVIGEGITDDPETSNVDPKTCYEAADQRDLVDSDAVIPDGCACATVNPDGNLLAVLLDALDNDPLKGFQGLDYEVMLRVGGEDGDPNLDQYSAKGLRVAARFPATRTANTNPSLRALQGQFEGGEAFTLEFGRCADNPLPMHEIPPDTKINLFPVESGGARETYVLPTLDGGSEMFTEALTYQWVANGGGLSRGDTGGPHDAFGNDAPLDTDWTSPPANKLDDGGSDFTIWIVQRDERLGVAWYETCMRVVAP